MNGKTPSSQQQSDRELIQTHLHHIIIDPTAIEIVTKHARNARTHSKKQIKQIAKSIEQFGFTNPVLISDENEMHLDAAQRRAYVIADNKLALNGGWDRDALAIELQALVDIEFDLELPGSPSRKWTS